MKPAVVKSVLTLLAVSLLAVMSISVSAQAPDDKPQVTTNQGKLIGEYSSRNQRVAVFKGIPFAAPPVGQARWTPPQPAPGWSGERMADVFGPDCMQQPYADASFFYRPARVSSEDCLYLNVWSTGEDNVGKPVMVWFHGGALTRGSGAIDTYDGTELALKDVVLVTVNYRLGVFGYFAHPELIAETAHFSAGNYGILDQIQSLRWVQENIAAFGGDPSNVTIFGESAGAWSVHFLTASPLAEGLFHKAIAQSGARLDTRVELDRQTSAGASASAAGSQFAQAIAAPDLAALRALPARQLLDAAADNSFRSDGIVDGWVLTEQPFAQFSAGRQHRVPVLVGFNSEEGTTLGAAASLPGTAQAYQERVSAIYGDLAEMMLEIYPATDIRKSSLDSFRDVTFGWHMVTWANLTRHVEQPAYLYFFTHRPPGPAAQELGAYHAAEIAYAFNNVHTLSNQPSAIDYRVGDIMSDYWVNFARTGVPAAPGQPEWKPYSNGERNYLLFGPQVSAELNLLPDNWSVIDRVMDRRR
jgi:para-nitrobenzyl esterase